MKSLKHLLASACALLAFALVSAQQPQTLTMPTVIGDNMVLQQNALCNIWGFAKPKAKVTVTPDWTSAVNVKADQNGFWQAGIQTSGASYDAHTVTVACGKESKTFQNILFGEVWLCSGQSNMEFTVQKTLDLKKDLKGTMNDAIRIYNSGRIYSETEQNDIPEAHWAVCNPKDLAAFSAVGYGFGKILQSELNVPVGLISADYGGTYIEGWLKKEVLENDPKIVSDNNAIKHKVWGGKPSQLYNANIYPIRLTTIAGVIWYQGCNNVNSRPKSYAHTLEVLINSWREEFRSPEMPFYIVQLVPHTYMGIRGAQVRECQAKTAKKMDHCEVVITNDQQDLPGDIHPRYKAVVAARLAACALGEHYGKGENFRSPELASYAVEGDKIRITLANVPTTIVKKGNGRINGFQIGVQDPEQQKLINFVNAEAVIEPDNTILVSAEGVTAPVAVRYCFNEDIGNVFSAEGLPLAPFRTDKSNASMSARPYIDAPSQISITFRGRGFERSELKEGAQMWPDLKQKLSEEYPREFEGFEMLTSVCKRPKGEKTPAGEITAHGDGRVYCIVRTTKDMLKICTKTGWRLIIPAYLRAVKPDGGKIAYQYIAYHDVKDGDTVKLPQVNDHYSVFVLAKKIEYIPTEE